MVYGIWYMVYGIWYMVYGIRYMVYGICDDNVFAGMWMLADKVTSNLNSKP